MTQNINELEKTYNPTVSEDEIYKFWQENDLFKADNSSNKEPYSIVIPPPNVTGVLHMGHALDGTLQDILVRYHRMAGYETLWVPGCDHAGIATQNVVEKNLRQENKSRFDLGREEFVKTTWTWANEHKDKILGQFKRLGASFDRSRERFTLDEGCSKAVKEVFVNLYNKGLIYKGAYIVNWCPRCRSAISDIETEYETEKGHLWEISYPLKNEVGAIVVATTRPETLFGDVAIAVNPNDFKYKDLVGKTVCVPLTGREIPIIADEYVDKSFGTGAVKITPAHDPNDYEVAKRHNLAPLWIMDNTGHMVKNDLVPEPIQGLERYEARKKTVELLSYNNSLLRIKDHEHNVGHCQRCGATIEPYLSEQWFVKMEPLAKRPIEAIEKGELKFIPERWTKTYLDWMTNVRDWCISRQLWWGHQIPAYYCQRCGKMIVATDTPESCPDCDCKQFSQDTDVLDTWFSSGLWPFSTMGWPDTAKADFQKFYPTTTLVTGFDIIFFWVARMVTMGYEFTDKAPFSTVFIHGLIRDEHGQKMSKSKGNTIDPVQIIDKYGCDALRFTLTSLLTYGAQDIKVSDERFEFGRNFANKIWNASRFVLMNLEGLDDEPIDFDNLTIADKWILDKLNQNAKLANENIKNYRIGEVAHSLYDFFWNNYCDWYVEIAKVQLQNPSQKANTQRVLNYVLERTLRLLHPIMPHITEKIWQIMPKNHYKDAQIALMKCAYPAFEKNLENTTAREQMDFIFETIKSIRNIRQSLNIAPSSIVDIQIYSSDKEEKGIIEQAQDYIKRLAKVGNITKNTTPEVPKASATAVIGNMHLYIPLEGLIDINSEIAKQNKKLEKLNQEKASLNGRLSNEKFVKNAPENVLEQTKERLEEIESQSKSIEALIAQLS